MRTFWWVLSSYWGLWGLSENSWGVTEVSRGLMMSPGVLLRSSEISWVLLRFYWGFCWGIIGSYWGLPIFFWGLTEVSWGLLMSYWGLLRTNWCLLRSYWGVWGLVEISYPHNVIQVIGCNRYSTVRQALKWRQSESWFLRYEHCKCSLAAILVLHDDVINSRPYNVIQVIGCNRYGTGRLWNEVDRTIGSWDMFIVNVFWRPSWNCMMTS